MTKEQKLRNEIIDECIDVFQKSFIDAFLTNNSTLYSIIEFEEKAQWIENQIKQLKNEQTNKVDNRPRRNKNKITDSVCE